MKSVIEGEMENLPLLERLYETYLADPSSLDSQWKNYFEGLAENRLSRMTIPFQGECRLHQLIAAYRREGFRCAKVNPLAREAPHEIQSLAYQTYGFTSEDLEKPFATEGLLPEETSSLSKILTALRTTYCGSIGFEYEGIVEPELEKWLRQKIENEFFSEILSHEKKKLILECLNRAESLETFLHMKYVGQKRFSLEGAETLIPMLALMLEEAGEHGLEETVLGMSHRGRLNVLTNILNKSYQALLAEFTDGMIHDGMEGMGDVKYHKGYIGEYIHQDQKNNIKVTLCPNPSHLESIDSVVEGETHAKQFLNNDLERNKIVPILIHGDAALSGQGVVYESLQLSQLQGYTTGGTIHFVINNQIGFTTIPRDMRSTSRCTDIAKTFSLPVFHVNAEDPEGCVKIALLAMEVRQKFHCDVFIELNGYRKYGHNEGDEPAYTQPVEYQFIKSKKSIRTLYQELLLNQRIIDEQEMSRLEVDYKMRLQEAHSGLQKVEAMTSDLMMTPKDEVLFQQIETGVPYDVLLSAAQKLSRILEGFHLHPKLETLVHEQYKLVEQKKSVDWGMAERLAYASLLLEGTSLRLSGQDSARGTFSHRHALWVDQQSSSEYFPLAHLKEGQGHFEVINSPLSEMAVLAFEYGYSVICTKGLTIWEAQFGDFANGAQVIIDQYIASGEQKWGQKSGLVLYLPHGYEGQGPEHSSARMERFLSLAGHDNMQIVNPSTPAQWFHLLRRQMHQRNLKPLIVFTPKGLLRLPESASPVQDLTKGSFQEVIDDNVNPKEIRKLVLCSGHIYYELIAKKSRKDLAIVRLEQLYPLNQEKLKSVISKYTEIEECLWVQEEHENMGAWRYLQPLLLGLLSQKIPLRYVGRSVSATPATGVHLRHQQESEQIMKQVYQ